VPASPQLSKVLDHLRLYDHPLLEFSARENDERVEVLIALRDRTLGAHTYSFPIHPRDLESPQFGWQLQRQLYDALHDYFIEMFTKTPQDRRNPPDLKNTM